MNEQQDLDFKEQKTLDLFLGRVEPLVAHLKASDKYNVLMHIKEDIIDTYRRSEGNSLSDILTRYSDLKSYVNVQLMKLGFPVAKVKKKVGIGKILLMSFLVFVVGGILAIVLIIKSFTPLMTVDQVDGALEFFGGHLVLEKDDSTFFTTINNSKLANWKLKAKKVNGTLNIDDQSIKKIELHFEKGQLGLRSSAIDDTFKYECLSDNQLADLVKTDQEKLVINLKGQNFCLIYLPPQYFFNAIINEGDLSLKNLDQSFEIVVDKGNISWIQKDKYDFNITHLKGQLIKGEKSLFQNKKAKYSASIEVQNGTIRLR